MVGENKKGIGFYLLYGVLSLVAMLPFGVLYFISDVLYIIVYYIAGYRKQVVRKNLINSFPHKKHDEIIQIEKKFYHHLCDYGVETIKTLRISDKEIRKRMVFKNPEVINRLTKDGNSCLLSLGHYGNWEWVPSISLYLLHGVEPGHVYKTLSSKAFNELFLKIRSRFNPTPIEMKTVYRTIIRNRNEGKALVVGFLSDQRPMTNGGDEYWTTFLNQDTQVQNGLERIAQQFGFAVVYLDIKKIKRGYYVGNFSVITADGSGEELHSIMEKYTRKLEETILAEPAYYLWSHNKWHRKKKQEE
ncbi:MAG: lysophospholipid acyltransferase family protein [Bacteroidia bacterium]|nr:lysophospholipid acyltransferase family protein [Bacteroidia bacterium]